MKKSGSSFLKVLVFFGCWAVLAGVLDIPSQNPAIWRFGAEAVSLLVLLAFTLLFSRFERERLTIPLMANLVRALLVGILVGLFWIGLPAGLLLAMGQFTLSINPAIPDFWIWILAAFINVVMQEFLIRGYIYQLLKTKHGLASALTVTTALFTLLHGGAFEAGPIAVVNVLTMCLFTSLMLETENNLLAPLMAHTVWNVLGGLVLGGIQLAEDYPSLFTMLAQETGLLSGGDYKLEGSLLVTVVNLVLLSVYYWTFKNRKGKNF